MQRHRSVALALALGACGVESLSSESSELSNNEVVVRVVDRIGDRIEVQIDNDLISARRTDRDLMLILPVREEGRALVTVFDGDRVIERGELEVRPFEGLAIDRVTIGSLAITTSSFRVRVTRDDVELGDESRLHADFMSPRGERLDVGDLQWSVNPDIGKMVPYGNGVDALFTQRIDGADPLVAICTESASICWDSILVPRNRAGVVRRTGGIQTNAVMSPSFTANDHTISMWFMAQYPRAQDGPLFTNDPQQSDEYGVSIAGEGGAGNDVWLSLRMGGVIARYHVPWFERSSRAYPWGPSQAPLPTPARWHHLAVVRTGAILKLYVDGAELLPEGTAQPPEDRFQIPISNGYTGPISLGSRVTRGQEPVAQFYGLVDDFAMFSTAKTDNEVAMLAGTYRLSGDEPDLVAAVLFDGFDPRPEIKQPTFERESWPAYVSATRGVAMDQAVLPLPYQRAVQQLPFAAPEVWQVAQEQDSDYSHRGYASFCLDFVRVPEDVVERAAITGSSGFQFSSIESSNQRILSTMDGYATQVDSGPIGYVLVEQDTSWPREFMLIAHLEAGTPRPLVGGHVTPRSALGQVDSAAQHLHIGAQDRPAGQWGGITFPVAYSNYEVSRDFGVTWQYVALGIPRFAEWVRRAEPGTHVSDRWCAAASGDDRITYDCD